MTDPDATKRRAFFLEQRYIEALLDPEGARSDVLADAKSHLRAVLNGEKQGIRPSDPREAGGSLIDPTGDPHARDAVLMDTRTAMLPEELEFAIANLTSDGDEQPEAVAMLVR